MAGNDWNFDKMLELYIHDYMVKHNMHMTAEIFTKEAELPGHSVAIDATGSFLSEWWSIFYDMFLAREQNYLNARECYAKVQQPGSNNDLKQKHPHSSRVQPLQMVPPKFSKTACGTNYIISQPARMDNEVYAGPSPGCLTSKMIEERIRYPINIGAECSIQHNTSKLSGYKGIANEQSHMHRQGFTHCQQRMARDNKIINGVARSFPANTLLHGTPKALLPGSSFSQPGLKMGSTLNGWPVTGKNQMLRPLLQNPNQLQQLDLHQLQQVLSQQCSPLNASLVPSISDDCSDVDPQRSHIHGSVLNGKSSQSSPCSSQQYLCSSDAVRSNLQEENRKKSKQLPHCGTRCTVMVSGVDVPMPDALAERYHAPKKLKTHFSGVEQTAVSMDCIADGDGGSSDDNVESFLSHDEDNPEPASCTMNGSLNHKNELEGLSFAEVSCLHSIMGKVLCCHFSSSGKLLASAGHNKKVTFWNMDDYNVQTSLEEHTQIITDVRFKPNSSVLATSSFDRTVKIWTTATPSHSLLQLVGHKEQVMSVDFHPMKDLLCSCDGSGEIRWWNMKRKCCERLSKGGSKQVRIEPCSGQLLASAFNNAINIVDIETDQLQIVLKGHSKDVCCICWHPTGDYVASVSEDSVRVWSAESGWKCVHHLRSNGNKFQSCTFHPGYPLLLVVGGYQSLQLWNPTSGQTSSIMAHKGMVAALSSSVYGGLIASASHDQCVKLWK